jgi:thiaminase/transcriptional activator TenA
VSLAQILWEQHTDLARQALGNPFVRGLSDGTLSKECFQRYVTQDAFFLEAFARAYALAIAHSPDREGLREFHDLIGGVLEELQLHAGYAAQWGIDLERVQPVQATLNYTDFLLQTASLGSVGELCAAMTPCMRLYAFLGQSLRRESMSADNPYQDWVRTYAAQEFEALAARLERLLNRYAEDTPQVRQAYRRAMQLEIAFFQANEPK